MVCVEASKAVGVVLASGDLDEDAAEVEDDRVDSSLGHSGRSLWSQGH